MLDEVFAGIGESAESASADRLFSLVGLLSGKLTGDESLDVLSYGLDLFNVVLEDADADGPWTVQLTPPTAVEDALAGYIWAGLSSPVAATRWEAAHAVVCLCALARTRVIAGLFAHASANTTNPFGDLRFVFYSLHGQQWLLIAAARAALEYGPTLVPHAAYILTQTTANQPHVLIRSFAARTALTLAAQGLISLPTDARQQLTNVNTSPFAIIKRNGSQKYANREHMAAAQGELPEKDRYFFGIDFSAPIGWRRLVNASDYHETR